MCLIRWFARSDDVHPGEVGREAVGRPRRAQGEVKRRGDPVDGEPAQARPAKSAPGSYSISMEARRRIGGGAASPGSANSVESRRYLRCRPRTYRRFRIPSTINGVLRYFHQRSSLNQRRASATSDASLRPIPGGDRAGLHPLHPTTELVQRIRRRATAPAAT